LEGDPTAAVARLAGRRLGARRRAAALAGLAGRRAEDLDVRLGAEGRFLEAQLEVVPEVGPAARPAAAPAEQVAEPEEVAQDVAGARRWYSRGRRRLLAGSRA